MELGTEEDRDLIAANRRFRDEATAAGIHLEYREFRGGHDLALWRGGIADALTHLWG